MVYACQESKTHRWKKEQNDSRSAKIKAFTYGGTYHTGEKIGGAPTLVLSRQQSVERTTRLATIDLLRCGT